MDSRSCTRRAAQAAAISALSKDDDSSKKKITFNIGSKLSSKKKETSASSQELAVRTSSDTDYPTSGSSAGVSKKSSHQLRSSQDDMFSNDVEDLPLSNSHSVPSSGTSLEYSLIKNSLTMSQGSNASDRVLLDSPEEGKVPRGSRTSTPRKRRPEKNASGTITTLQNIAEDVPLSQESNLEEINLLSVEKVEADNSVIDNSLNEASVIENSIIENSIIENSIIENSQTENSQTENTQMPLKDNEFVGASSKRKRQDSSQMSDSQLPDTLKSSSKALLLKKSRQSVEYIGEKTHNSFSKSTQHVFDLDDELDDSEPLYLSQSQSQKSQNMKQPENFVKLSRPIPPNTIEIDDEVGLRNDCSMPSIRSSQETNGNFLSHGVKLNNTDTLPLDFDTSLSKLNSSSNLHQNVEQEVFNMPNSYSIYASVKDNFSLAGHTVISSPRTTARSGSVHRGDTTTPMEIINLDSDSHNTPENTNGMSAKHDDVTVTYHSVLLMVNYSRTVNNVTKNCTRELVDCCVHEGGQKRLEPAVADISPGALTDISGLSKDTSPAASVTSLGMYPLQPMMRQSMVSTTSSSSASSAASLHEKNLMKSGPNYLRPMLNASNKSTNFDKNTSKDLKIETCITDKYLSRLENDVLLFASPTVLNIPLKKSEPQTKSKPRRSIGKPSPAPISEVLSEEKSDPPTKEESLPSTQSSSLSCSTSSNISGSVQTQCSGESCCNGSILWTSVPDGVQSLVPPSTPKSTKKATSVKQTVAEIAPDTPKSSTKKQVGRTRARKLRPTAARKAKMTPIAETMPEAQESTSKEKNGRVPAARKGLVLTPKPTANSRRIVSEESTVEELLDPPITPDQPMLAFARWTDRRYYSCTVTGSMRDGRYNIKFDDGAAKCVAEEFVIPVNQLWKGLSIFAKTSDKDYEPGSIVKLEVKDGIVMYVVELDSFKSVSIPRSALFMTEDQAKVLQEETWGYSSPSCGTKRPADVSLDNMVGGKRRRFASILQRLPKVSGENKPPATPATMTPFSDTSDDVNVSNEEICGLDVEFYPIPYPSLKDGGLSKTVSKVKGRGKNVATEKTTDMQLNELLGPIPEEGSKLFAGMQFLFTSVGTTSYSNDLGRLNESANAESASDGPDSFYKIPLFKERLVAQLVAGGGIVHEKFEHQKAYWEWYLIASGPCQTAKYLLCLAHKIPIISHEWVIASTKAGKKLRVNRYFQPAGKSIMDHGALIEQKERSSRDQALKNMDVLIISEVDDFIGFWSKVLEAMGARVSSLSPDSDEWPKETDVNVILSDNSIVGSSMKSWADNFGVRVVNPEWVKYCLIKGVKGDINFDRFSILEY